MGSRTPVTLVLLVAVVLGVGCGDDEAAGPRTAPAPTVRTLEGGVSLVVEVDPDGRGGRASSVERLRCQDVDRRAARAVPASAWSPVPPDAACTRIYGGPQTARVYGSIGPRQIDARFDRSGGCEIARWDDVLPLFRAMAEAPR